MSDERRIHPLIDFLSPTVLEIDTSDVELHTDANGTYVAYRDGTDEDDDEDVVRIYLDDRTGTSREPTYPIQFVGQLGATFTRDQVVNLAIALLALAREHDTRHYQSYWDRNR